jgi:ABC-type proline/glycine betaine transport system ATPase subunit
MQDELLSLQETVKKTIVFITHNLDEAVRISDQIVLLKDGALVMAGINQIIMLPLSIVIAAMIGARGLGDEV